MRSQVDQLLFPEMMGKCIIINTPNLFSYVWAMFSPLVDARTRSKVSVYAIDGKHSEALSKGVCCSSALCGSTVDDKTC